MAYKDQMALIRQFVQSDSAEIADWKLSDIDLLFWANIVEPNSNLKQMLEVWHGDSDTYAFVLEAKSELIGYGEIWIESKEVELARLVVKPEFRGQGFGKALLNELLLKARSYHKTVWLRVHPDNQHAKSLYARNGFSVAADTLQAEFNQQQPVQYVWMTATAKR